VQREKTRAGHTFIVVRRPELAGGGWAAISIVMDET